MKPQNIQIRKNLIFNILSLVVNIVVGILYTPYLVNALGIVAYGVVPLALIINQYISVITGSLTSALTRFYTISLQKNEKEEASKYLSTSFLVVLGIVLILTLPLFFFVNRIDVIFNIPAQLITSAKVLFTFTLMSFIASLFSSVFNITLYAYNRLDYLNVLGVIRLSLRFFIIVFLFSAIEPDISYIGIASFITEFLILLLSAVIFWKMTKGTVKINFKHFNKSSLVLLSVMTSWVVVQQFGDTLLYRIDNVIINKFWSTKESGIIGAYTELGAYTMTIATVISSLFGPLILQAYGKNDHNKVRQMTLDNSLIVGLIVGVMIGIICGFSPIILKIWLGDDFVAHSDNTWLIFKLILIPFYAAAGVFSFAARAWNKVKLPAIGTMLLGAVNILIVWFIANFFNTSDFAISLILCICMLFGIIQSYFLNGFLFGTFYMNTHKIILLNFLKIALVLIISLAIGCFLSPYLVNYSELVSLIIIAMIAFVFLIVSIIAMLTKEQSILLIGLIRKKNI